MKDKLLPAWAKIRFEDLSNRSLLLGHLESLATIDEDRQQKLFLKELINNYVLLEKRVDALLKNTLPAVVIDEIKDEGRYLPRACTCTIMFTDFVGFTRLAAAISAAQLVETLDALFSRFDEIVGGFEGTKIKTIGDAYMAVFGAPVRIEDHAVKAIGAALAMTRHVERFNVGAEHQFHMRVGIHTGEVMAGVVGKERMQFDVFGDSVNIAARFETSGEADRINVSETTRALARGVFNFERRGKIRLKNKDDMHAYFVIDEAESTPNTGK